VRYSIVERSSDEIDRENILACTENGMVMAVERLEVGADAFPPFLIWVMASVCAQLLLGVRCLQIHRAANGCARHELLDAIHYPLSDATHYWMGGGGIVGSNVVSVHR